MTGELLLFACSLTPPLSARNRRSHGGPLAQLDENLFARRREGAQDETGRAGVVAGPKLATLESVVIERISSHID